MTPSEAGDTTALRKLALLVAVVQLVAAGCQKRNKCEEFRDIAVERNDRCESGLDITMGDLECSAEDARRSECLIACYQLPCDDPADAFDACLFACV